MTHEPDHPTRRPSSTVKQVALLGALTVMVLIALVWAGVIACLNASVSQWMGERMGEEFPLSLPPAVWWGGAVVVAYGLPLLMLSCALAWQRMVIWLVSMAVLASWVPVLCLAAHKPELALPCLAALCSGLLLLIHAAWRRTQSRGS